MRWKRRVTLTAASAMVPAAGITLVRPAIAESSAPAAKPSLRFELLGTYVTDNDPDTAGGEVAALRDDRTVLATR